MDYDFTFYCDELCTNLQCVLEYDQEEPDVGIKASMTLINAFIENHEGLCVAGPWSACWWHSLGRDTHAVRSPLVGRPAPGSSLAPAGGGPICACTRPVAFVERCVSRSISAARPRSESS